MQDYELASKEASELFASINGLKSDVSSPVGMVGDNEWPCIGYTVRFTKDGNTLVDEYKLGVGHVKWPKKFEQTPHGTPSHLIPVFNTLRENPNAKLKRPLEHAEAAAWLAAKQKVAPKPYEVLACLCRDGLDAHSQSFENWAADFGFDSDSIKAKRNYDHCVDTYHKAVRLIGRETLAKLAELHARF